MMLYLLAMASPTNPIPTASWTAWARPTFSYQGMYFISSGAPLFTHQYSHAWFDFRNKKDVFANYYQNSVTATMAHGLFCISLAGQFSDYRETCGEFPHPITGSQTVKLAIRLGAGRRHLGRLKGPSCRARRPVRCPLILRTPSMCCAGFAGITLRRGSNTDTSTRSTP